MGLKPKNLNKFCRARIIIIKSKSPEISEPGETQTSVSLKTFCIICLTPLILEQRYIVYDVNL